MVIAAMVGEEYGGAVPTGGSSCRGKQLSARGDTCG